MTDTLEHFTKGSIVALVCVAAILKFILSKRDEKTGKWPQKSLTNCLVKLYISKRILQSLFDKRIADLRLNF